MQYAILNDKKIEALPHQKAQCPCCRHEVISRCGELKIWHWAHTVKETCDSWHEPETKWHRDWKRVFGKKNSEVIIIKNDVKHIADIYTNDKIVIELQNSPISTDTIKARENFYGERMLWVINVQPFSLHFNTIGRHPDYETSHPENLFYNEHLLPDPGWFLDFGDIIFDETLSNFLRVVYRFEYVADIKKYFRHGRRDYEFGKFFLRLVKEFNERNGIAQPDYKTIFYSWKFAWKSWTAANRPTFIDYDRDNLFFVKSGLGTRYGSGIIINKQKFIAKYRTL